MKKNYFIAILALVCQFAIAQVQQTSFRGAFAPAPTAMWTNSWTNFDPNNATYGAVTTTISTDITSSVTWTKDKVYELNGLITVRNNAILTIQAGTVIRSNVASSALVIARGSKLNAIGTAAEPIVFTSNNAATSRNRGDWGGIVMLGKARYNTNNGVNFIEGLSQTVNTEFGGGTSPIDNDNSGSLKYVRIEFAGYVFAPNNELNGLTMGAVGSGTTIDYVQVSYSNDDSFEWFGGSVNCKHLVAFNGLDDDFDVDAGFKGVVQFGLSIKDPLAADISTSEAFEVDNNAGGTDTTVLQSYGDFTSAVFTNITCIGPNARPNGSGGFVTPNGLHDKALRLRKSSQPKIFNSIFLDHKKGLVIESLSSNAAAIAGNLKFKNNLIVSPTAFKSDGTGNTTTTSTPTTAEVLTWFNASGNTTYTTNTGLLTRPYDLTSATNFKTITDNTDLVNIDYRPASIDATTGASFTDASLSGLIAVGNAPAVTPSVNYCKGVVASALNATMTETGVSLRWYTTFTTTTVAGVITKTPKLTVYTTTAPVPATTTVGTKSYWVAEVNADNVPSATAKIDVYTADSPAVVLGAITGTAAVGPAVGTATPFTYSVPASDDDTIASYYWTVPLGATIVSGQDTNSIVVKYNNVPAGVLKIGNITVQARNAGLCGGPLKSLAITAVLPAAPAAIKMTDALLLVPVSGIATAVTSFAKYMGQSTELALTATAVAAATSYVWELPTGVNLLNKGAVSNTTTLFYGVYPFTVAISKPSAVGNEYYQVVTTTYANGITIAEASRFVVGGKLANNVLVAPVGGFMATSSTDATPAASQTGSAGVFKANAVGVSFTVVNGVTVNPAFPIVASTSNAITVNFADVTSANTVNYTTTAGVSTNVLRIGVKSRNGVGVSVTANAAPVYTIAASTAKLLTLTAVRPAAPAAIKVTNDAVSTSTAVTVISKFIGTTTTLKVTATPSLTASSYTWELPAGVNLVSGELSGSSSNVITVNFENVSAGTTSLYLGVKAVNGIGSSVTANGTLLPSTTSTAKLLKLTATVPATVATVTGQVAGLCANGSYNYTMLASPLANTYEITAPAGSVVTSANGVSGATPNVLTTSDLTFTVVYPVGFSITTSTATAGKSLVIKSINGVGNNVTSKTLTLSTAMAAIVTVTGPTTYSATSGDLIYTVTPVVGATEYVATVPAGASIVSTVGNVITVNYDGVTTPNSTFKVVAKNVCGVASAIKSINLTKVVVGARLATQDEVAVSATEVYPNPASSEFNIDVTGANGDSVTVSVYSYDGSVAVNPFTIQLVEGSNTINQNIASLRSGIYFVRVVNNANNEVIVKKLIKG